MRLGIWETNPQGKYPAQTLFRGVLYSEKLNETLVICKPLTGRTHQIRIHLQWIDFPISNDTCYGYLHEAKKENKKRPKPDDSYLDDAILESEDNTSPKAKKSKLETTEESASASQNTSSEDNDATCHGVTDDTDPLCADCKVDPLPVDPELDLVLFLHAWVYMFDDKRYETRPPSWCMELFGGDEHEALRRMEAEMHALMEDAKNKRYSTIDRRVT